MKNSAETTVGSVEKYLTEKMTAESTNGNVSLDDIQKSTGLERADVVKQVRAFKGDGEYVIGRRGGKSRYLWGTSKTQYKESQPAQSKKTNSPKNDNHSINSGYKLELTIGGQKQEIPISLALIH